MFGFAVGFFYGLSRWFNFSRATTGALMLSGGLANLTQRTRIILPNLLIIIAP
jgi:hypothetical protein